MLNDTDMRKPEHQPVFNVPGVILGLIVAIFAVFFLFQSVSSAVQDEIIIYFALFPARFFAAPEHPDLVFPGGVAAQGWTLVTYTFLHGGWTHVIFNSVWLLAFGSPVAQRLGITRFLLFYFVCGIIGGFTQILFSMGSLVPIVGASASISGLMGGAARFVFQAGGPLAQFNHPAGAPRGYRKSRIMDALTDRRVLIFVGVWIGLNFLFGPTGITFTGERMEVAWLAHLGGFLAGLLLFGFFEPLTPSPSGGPGNVGYGEWSGSRNRREM